MREVVSIQAKSEAYERAKNGSASEADIVVLIETSPHYLSQFLSDSDMHQYGGDDGRTQALKRYLAAKNIHLDPTNMAVLDYYQNLREANDRRQILRRVTENARKLPELGMPLKKYLDLLTKNTMYVEEARQKLTGEPQRVTEPKLRAKIEKEYAALLACEGFSQ